MVDRTGALESRRLSHPVALEQPRQLLDERALFVGALEADVEVVDARHRDHVDTALQQRCDDLVRQDVAGRLHGDLHSAGAAVARSEALDQRVAQPLAQRLEQELAAGEDDASLLLGRRSVRAQVASVEIGHPLGQMIDDPRHVLGGLAHHALELAARVGRKRSS